MNNDYIYFEKDFYPFWDYLGLDENSTFTDVLEKSKQLSEKDKEDPFIRFAWKALKDPFYINSYKKYRSISALYDSGFFIDQYQDNNDISYDLNYLTTPLDKIKNQIKLKGHNDKPLIVLLTTGGFSPIHKRHVEVMEIAKEKMENEGYHVVGGYLSPSHDNYVSQKHQGRASLNVEKRVYLIEKVIENSDWLYVDKWEAYYNKCSINYTDVILRLEAYLNHHIKTKSGIKVCYVFGADNAGFVRAFINDGYAICLDRIGYNDKMTALHDEFKKYKNIFFIENTEKEKTSSSLVRSGSKHLLHDNIKGVYDDLRCEEGDTTRNDIYAIRNDMKKAILSTNLPLEQKLVSDVVEYFKNILLDTFNNEISIKEILLDNQYEKAEQIISTLKRPTLSLDVYIHGDVDFNISRLFELATAQLKPKQLVNRPNTPPLEEQIKDINDGSYVLIEDDLASGSTLEKLYELLPKSVVIDEQLILSRLDDQNNKEKFFDIVDMRDFIFGLNHSGLVVSLPNGENVRVPYALPYTSPISRAKIPFGKEVSFSLLIWEMNKHFYENLQKEIYLRDMDNSFIKLMEYVGFNKENSIIEIIDWHIGKLKRVVE